MALQVLQNSVLVFTVCLVLVIISAGNFKVSAAAQQYEAKTLESGCPNINDLEEVKSKLIQSIRPLIEQLADMELPITRQTTEQSIELPTTGQITEQSMSTTTDPLEPCGGPGWRQVVFINMTDTSYNCPPGLRLTSYSKRTCSRAHTNTGDCSSTTFSVGGSEYNRVCGRIRGYQVAPIDAFLGYLQNSNTFEDPYVDGLSLTYGPVGGRNHIWTFAGRYTDIDDSQFPFSQCPCDISDSRVHAPPFVGNDYFCESGADIPWPWSFSKGRIFPDDPLWDGQGCSFNSTCCQLNNPPWFTKTLPNPTTDDIELRLCIYSLASDEDIAIELIELHVQ